LEPLRIRGAAELISGESKDISEMGLEAVEVIFALWHALRDGGLSRRQLQREIVLIRRTLREWLERGCACQDAKTAAFCENVLAVEPALWTFVRKEGVEPTNNHMERLLRPGVLWRKNAFGCHSEAGCHYVERLVGERPTSNNFQWGALYAGRYVDHVLGGREISRLASSSCAPGPYHFEPKQLGIPCAYLQYWSFHANGAHFLISDGSVRFLGYDVDSLLPGLATRGDADVAPFPD
jgi:hypothetical protein